jgi:hypothetical protein
METISMLLLCVPVTVTVFVPDLLVSTVEVALTSIEVCVSPDATVSNPLVLIAVPVATPAVVMLHVTVCAGSFSPATAAVNCRAPPLATPAALFAAVTVTLVTVGVPPSVGVSVLQPARNKPNVSVIANIPKEKLFFAILFSFAYECGRMPALFNRCY